MAIWVPVTLDARANERNQFGAEEEEVKMGLTSELFGVGDDNGDDVVLEGIGVDVNLSNTVGAASSAAVRGRGQRCTYRGQRA